MYVNISTVFVLFCTDAEVWLFCEYQLNSLVYVMTSSPE